MQDEPGGRGCFACKMSLERGSAMLGIDDQSEQQTGNEPGRDPGFLKSQRSRAFRRREKGGDLRLGERVPGGAELGPVGAYGARFGAAVSGENDGAEPGADHASDHPYGGDARCGVKPEAISAAKHRPAGGSGEAGARPAPEPKSKGASAAVPVVNSLWVRPRIRASLAARATAGPPLHTARRSARWS